MIFGAGAAAVTWLGSEEVLRQQLTIGELMMFLTYLGQLYEPLNQLSQIGATVSGAGAGVRRVFELLDTPEEVKDKPNARRVISAKAAKNIAPSGSDAPLLASGRIDFEGVAFNYAPDRVVLHDLTFSLPPGDSVAIIGPSGVGKTTLLHLLPRFFDPDRGAVKLDGADLRDLRLKDLRAQVALVLQEPIILPASVAENIAYGKPGASRDEIEAAARAANADVFIQKMPQKYESLLGEGGARLSVGERQRINLARAFLKDAPVLLLDEPTSALDADSEMLVTQSLAALMQGRTTLMVAHRLSTIGRMSRVMVLEDGALSEFGTHAELRERGGYYTRVVSGQVQLE